MDAFYNNTSQERKNELALFAGAGGGILGGKLLGWRTVCAVERDAYAAAVLAQRQNDGHFDPFPIWSDIETFDGRPWRGLVDVVSGGFPCQDISRAKNYAKGIEGEKSALWKHMARIINEVRPGYALVENSPQLVSRGLGRVITDLASMGYGCRWGVFSACSLGAPHSRERLFLLAHPNLQGQKRCGSEILQGKQVIMPIKPDWWITEPGMGRVANGMAYKSHRLKAIGNGQVPAVVRLAFKTLNYDYE